jgi:flagellar biosynthesis GTPase FlhF
VIHERILTSSKNLYKFWFIFGIYDALENSMGSMFAYIPFYSYIRVIGFIMLFRNDFSYSGAVYDLMNSLYSKYFMNTVVNSYIQEAEVLTLELSSETETIGKDLNAARIISSNDFLLEDTPNEATLNEATPNEATQEETSNVAAQSETSNEAAQNETSNVLTQEETSNEAAQSETSNEAAQSETSNEAAQSETSNETSNEAAQNETSNETSNEAAQNETSNETSNEAAQNETSGKFTAHDPTSDDSLNVIKQKN